MNDNSRLVGRFVSVPDGTARANQCCPSWWSWHTASHEPTNLDLGFTGVGGMKVGGQGWEDSVHKVLRPQTEKRVVSLQPFFS